MQINITGIEEKYCTCPYLRREKGSFLSLLKNDFKIFLNCFAVHELLVKAAQKLCFKALSLFRPK